ncbi:neutral zinc metallopeptidase [Streptosporangium carneum]|uniref:neutral zinc metallopeptidase n=1 Tax=Streptosporangium carneum TaxID=47481 RepID=UPI0022F2FBFE|nr:neutral zinc metallopeptidase [Streptosporangium carneum]
MHTPRIALLAGALAGLLFTGTAHAGTGAAGVPVPTGTEALTRNPLYRSGKLTVPCGHQLEDSGSFTAAKKHLTAMLNCLDASWSAQLKKVGLPFKKPKIRFMAKPSRACGSAWGKNVTGRYCDNGRQLVILISDYAITDPADPVTLHLIAHEYAHHLQNLTGMATAYQNMPARTKAQALTQSRRLELQADCLGAAFMGSVWASQEYQDRDWKDVVDLYRQSGDEEVNKERSHGTGKNRVAWLQKGFTAASPAACNTWTAPASHVA